MILEKIGELFSLNDTYGEVNAGGIYGEVRLLPIDWVEKLDEPVDGMLQAGGLVLKPNAYWIGVLAVDNGVNYNEKSITTEYGIAYEPTLRLELPKVRPSVVSWVREYAKVGFLAMFKDRNGYNRLVGTVEQPLNVLADMTTGMRAGKNFTALMMNCVMPRPSLFVDSMNEALAYISMTQDINAMTQVLNNLPALMGRIAALEGQVAKLNGIEYKLYSYYAGLQIVPLYPFMDGSEPLPIIRNGFYLTDWVTPINLAKIDIFYCTLNGQVLKGKVVNMTEPWRDDIDYYIVSSDPCMVLFNEDTVTLRPQDIVQILVRRKP